MLKVNSLLCFIGKSAWSGFSSFLLFALIALGFGACNNDDDSGSDTTTFDRTEMLTWYADELIIPHFLEAKTASEVLKQSTTDFVQNPDETNLLSLQNAWETAYESFLAIHSYNFGPGSSPTGSILENVGTFPIDTIKTLNYINTGDFSLNNFDRDTRGLLGAEYLIFDLDGNNQKILNRFADENFRNYLTAVVDRIHETLSEASNDWGTYRSDFIANNGTDPGSSVSLMYNEFIKSYEAYKNFKVGLPAGKRAGQTNPEPSMVEAYYSGKSLDFQEIDFSNFQNMYYGISANGENGIGWDDYLNSVPGGADLVSSTQTQFSNVENAFDQLPNERFSQIVVDQPATLDTYYMELSKLTRFVKSDMSSILGIAITYDSGDGD